MAKKYLITAIIYDKRGRVLSIGRNSYTKTHPLQFKYAKKVGTRDKIYIHAELDAVLKCPNLERAHKIVVFRYDNDGNEANAKPCAVCQEMLSHTKIKIVEHT